MTDGRSRVDPTPAVAVGENLLRLKRGRGLSLSEIARRPEIHRTHVSLIIRGKRMVQIDTVVKLAGALEVEPGELLRGVVWVPGVEGQPRTRGPITPGRYRLDRWTDQPGSRHG